MPNTQSAISNSQSSGSKRKVVLAIASAGGHWVQLRRLHPAFASCKVIYSTTRESYRAEVETDGVSFRVVPDCNRWEKWKLFKSACAITWLILTRKPDVIVTTGAAPGFFAIRIGKFLGKRAVWIDSIANAEELSLSGKKAGLHAHLWLTQWQHLAKPNGPQFSGNVLGDDTPSQVPASEPSPASNPQFAIRNPQSAEGSEPQSKRKLSIFVTVGTDLPFDRLVKAIDDWAPAHPEFEIFAQIGETNWTPKNIPYCQFIEPPEFKRRFQKADLVVSHAGMGTILSSLSFQKPLLVMPRIAALGEHRNEHQLATAKHLAELNKVNVAPDETALLAMLDNIDALPVKAQIGPHASQSLTDKIKSFIAND